MRQVNGITGRVDAIADNERGNNKFLEKLSDQLRWLNWFD